MIAIAKLPRKWKLTNFNDGQPPGIAGPEIANSWYSWKLGIPFLLRVLSTQPLFFVLSSSCCVCARAKARKESRQLFWQLACLRCLPPGREKRKERVHKFYGTISTHLASIQSTWHPGACCTPGILVEDLSAHKWIFDLLFWAQDSEVAAGGGSRGRWVDRILALWHLLLHHHGKAWCWCCHLLQYISVCGWLWEPFTIHMSWILLF